MAFRIVGRSLFQEGLCQALAMDRGTQIGLNAVLSQRGGGGRPNDGESTVVKLPQVDSLLCQTLGQVGGQTVPGVCGVGGDDIAPPD